MTNSPNLDLVRSLYAKWERGDYSSISWAAPDIEFAVVDGPSPGSWSGIAGMADAFREIMNAWEGYRATAEEYRELQGDRVLVLQRLDGRGKTSAIDIGQIQPEAAATYDVREGKVSRVALYWDRDRAFADLGLTPEGGAARSTD